jgi:CRISPR/Cas system type I-B associated protein Csh2 (Cas7 group RAMP superfamily)
MELKVLKGKINLPYEEKAALTQTDAKKTLREAWLKG